jgi:hypothetical protein
VEKWPNFAGAAALCYPIVNYPLTKQPKSHIESIFIIPSSIYTQMQTHMYAVTFLNQFKRDYTQLKVPLSTNKGIENQKKDGYRCQNLLQKQQGLLKSIP